MQMSALRWIQLTALYFCCVFGIGFLLGPIRILALEPRFGVRIAELIEAPFMLATIVLVSHWVGGKIRADASLFQRLGVGMVASLCILAADLAVGVRLRDMTMLEVFTERDPVSGPIYYALVVVASLAPWWFSSGPTDR